MISFFIFFISSFNFDNIVNESQIPKFYTKLENPIFQNENIEDNSEIIEEEMKNNQNIYFIYKDLINLSSENEINNEKNVNIIVLGNGINQTHQELKSSTSFPDNLYVYGILENETQYFNSSDIDNSLMTKNLTSQIEGTSSTSIAFGSKIGITTINNINVEYYPFPLHSMYPLQNLTETLRNMNIKNTSILLFSADHYSFKISSGNKSGPYVELKYWTNLTESLLNNNKDLIILLSAGNMGTQPFDVQYHSFGFLPYTGVVSSVTHLGTPAYYSEWSSSILCCAPGGGIDTNTEGSFKYNPRILSAYPSDFNVYTGVNGTNGASAIVAGIVSSLKQSHNEDIDFRLFKYMVAMTSTINDPFSSVWIHNKGSFYHHHGYGFGIINSGKLHDINVADLKSKIGTYVNSTHYPSKDNDNPQYLSYGNEETPSIPIYVNNPKAKYVEEVQLRFSLRKCIFTDLAVILVSPSGTVIPLNNGAIGNGYTDYPRTPLQPLERYVITSRAFFGEPSEGVWDLRVKHAGYIPLDEIWGISLTIYGSNNTKLEITSNQENGEDPFENYTNQNEDNQIIITTSNISHVDDIPVYECNKDVYFTFNATIFANSFSSLNENETIRLSTFLSHSHGTNNQEPYRIFDLPLTVDVTHKQATNGEIIKSTFQIPCLVNNEVFLTFGVRDPIYNTFALSNKFKIQNNYSDFSVYNYEPYHTFDSVENITFSYARQSDHLPEHAYLQQVYITIFDMYSRNLVYTGYSTDNGNVTIPFNKDIPRGVLSISTTNYFDENYCNSVIYPFRYYKNKRTDYPDQKFNLFLNSNEKCPIPPEIREYCLPRDYFQELDTGIQSSQMFVFGIFFPFFVFLWTTVLAFCGRFIANRTDRPDQS